MGRTNALNINRLAKYNFKFISIEEVLVFEYLISYFQKNLLDQVVMNRIEMETGLRRNKIVSSCEKLKEKGFIEITNESMRKKFSLDLEKIESKVDIMFVKNFKYGKQFVYSLRNPTILKSKSKKSKSAIEANVELSPKDEKTPMKVKLPMKGKTKKESATLNQMSLF